MKFIKKNYMSISITFLILAIYVILFPFVSKALIFVFPSLAVCPYLAMTGKPCPLCGGTRYIAGLGNVFKDPSYLFHPFGLIILFVIFEIVFRIICIRKIKQKKPLEGIILLDLIIHMVAFASFILYEVLFLINS